MVRIVLKPYPTLEFEGPLGFVAFALAAFMTFAVTLLVMQR